MLLFLSRLLRQLSSLIEQFPADHTSYRSVREFLTEIYRFSTAGVRAVAIILIVISIPIAVYLLTSESSPFRRGHAAPPSTPPSLITPIPTTTFPKRLLK